MSVSYNERAQRFLENLGFQCEPEPGWVDGRKPDFFCTNNTLNIWVEVTSLPPSKEDRHLSRIREHLCSIQGRVTGGGRAIAFINNKATERHASKALNLVKYALQECDRAEFEDVVVVVPTEPDFLNRLHMRYTTSKGDTLLVTYKSSSSLYGYPYSSEPEPYDQQVTLLPGDGENPVWLDQIAKRDNYLIAVQICSLDEKSFKISGVTPSDPIQKLATSRRIRKTIRDKNEQIKNGLRYREAPAALFLYQEGALVPGDEIILAALFGDLQYQFDPERFREGRWQFGPNGALRGQHSSISTVVYFRNEGDPLTVHNPWAARDLPPGVFGGREYVASKDGTLHLIA